MSNELTDELLAERLRNLLKLTKSSQRDISAATGVPYRTVQSYFSGGIRMPATFLLAVCRCLDVEPDYLLKGDFKPRKNDLYDAVYEALAEEGFFPPDDLGENHRRRIEIATEMTINIRDRYDKYRRDSVFQDRKKARRTGKL